MADHPYPIVTYRLQLTADFRFEDAKNLVPYLSRLGVTHVYCSPILRARSDSTHGYDVVDPTTLNSRIGDEPEFRELVTSLQSHGMGVIVDIVPNHMATGHENSYWNEVLTYGPSSPHAGWFDIDWRLPDPLSWGRVLVPVLGQRLARVLDQDQIHIVWREGRFEVRYFDHIFPLDPGTVPIVCRFGLRDLYDVLPEDHPAVTEIRHVLERLAKIPRRATRVRRQVELPLEDVEIWLAQLAQRIEMLPQIHDWAERTCERFGAGDAGRQRLRKLLDAQSYRLVYWRRAARAINYRRFFDINDLISLRQEDPEVFNETHGLIGRWAREGWIDGVRVDHLDGLRDPAGYLQRLAELAESAERRVVGRDSQHMVSATSAPPPPLEENELDDSAPRLGVTAARAFAATTASAPFHIFVEKILAHDEHLPSAWPVNGTTGYDFLNEVESVFILPEGFEEIEDQYLYWIGRPVRFKNIAAWGKRRVLKNELSAFVGRLADIVVRMVRETDETTSLSQQEVVDAIVEVAVALPIYRTYVGDDGVLSTTDRRYVEIALARARRTQRATAPALDCLASVLLGDGDESEGAKWRQERANFIQRFQQLSGPATAKGVEDTAHYAYVPLVSRNEVGGEPNTSLDNAVGALHDENRFRADTCPYTMLCVTTHDTKRTADVRARLDVLSETPKLWIGYIKRWQRLNRPHRGRVAGKSAPDPAMECLFYQSLVGIWPAAAQSDVETPSLPSNETLQDLRRRLEDYMVKAAREAKTRTSWVKQNAPYEEALITFIRSVFLASDDTPASFLGDVQQLVNRIARAGFWNSLSRTLIQLTSPGTPDIYQGDELWNLALVDPDNRRAVDYEVRQQLLDAVAMSAEDPDHERRAEFLEQLVRSPEDGRIKLHMIRCALHTRREHPDLFARSTYHALAAHGFGSDNVVTYARAVEQDAMVLIVPRLTLSLTDSPGDVPIGESVWRDTAVSLPSVLHGREWICALTRQSIREARSGQIRVAEAVRTLPAALLVSQ